ncbi:MAG: hypothetical protein PHQ41_08930 [Candidatus Cloacimonetes bacterium]|nr:hypothetical protein [Candidatus Cloacimonadota bacterium]
MAELRTKDLKAGYHHFHTDSRIERIHGFRADLRNRLICVFCVNLLEPSLRNLRDPRYFLRESAGT